ncbi:signal transduction histidine kinase [Litorimonas taeanensis]|uniref:histidine kinase n=2 Tax=Litorimonas taeanensis TaxID=568099 RepID=A0A420WKA8_9PROT|nr:signal transduction histidine kinase [Litorimonas taeanensis]
MILSGKNIKNPYSQLLGSPEGPNTDRRQSARRAEDYFWLKRLGDMSNQALLMFDTDLSFEFANKLTLTLFDFDEQELASLNSYDEFIEHCVNRGDFGQGAKSTLKSLSTDLKAKARSQEPEMRETYEVSTPSGRRLSLNQSFGQDGRMLLAVTDITEEYESKRMLDLAMKVGSAGYWSYNIEDGEWKISSKYLGSLFGKDRIQLAKTEGIAHLIHEDDRAHCLLAWENCLQKGESWDLKARLISKTGETVWYRGFGIPRIAENGNVISVFCYYTNVSEQMLLQAQQRLATKTARKALTAKNSFLSRLSHEVRTPMNAVIGISDALIFHHSDPEITPKLELIQNSAEKILRIVDESLTHSKFEEGMVTLDPKPTDPKKCVENVCKLWELQAKKNNITFTYRIDPNLPSSILMDGYRYDQCVNNLLSNATKFSENGTVQVVLTKVSSGAGHDNLVLAVKDDGIGMTPEQQKQIFEPYTQADKTIASRFGGTGLGMTITKQITEMMGGTIKVKSALGQGAMFVISIPMKSEQSLPAPTTEVVASENNQTTPEEVVSETSAQKNNASPEPVSHKLPEEAEDKTATTPPSPQTINEESSSKLVGSLLETSQPNRTKYSDIKLLVVDDNATNHMVVASLLDSVVGSIVTANDGMEAIETLKTQEFDVVLMDIHMPVMDGIEATLSIRSSNESYSDIPIIALTADPQYQQKRLCLNIGMDEALAKPVKLAEILAAFDSVLEHGTQSLQKASNIA